MESISEMLRIYLGNRCVKSPVLPRWVLVATPDPEDPKRTQRGETGEKPTFVTGFVGYRHNFPRTPSHFWVIWRELVVDLFYPFNQVYFLNKNTKHDK